MKTSEIECKTPKSKIISKLIICYEIFQWFSKIGLKKKAIPCWIDSLDSILFIILIFSLSLMSVGIIFGHFTNFFYLLKIIIFFSLMVGLASSIIFVIISNRAFKLGMKQFQEYPEYNSNVDHHGILLPIYSKKRADYSLIPLFVEGFYNKVPYKIYPIACKKDFLSVYYNNRVRYLWILGHGERGSLCYGKCDNRDCICYSKRLPQKSKQFIAQLHCNTGRGKTLAEVNGITVDHETSSLRFEFQNRYYIKKKIQEFTNNMIE